ncbi:MAG TPA: RNA polymerase factor sigma-54 [Burkholderiales bacterium]|nr:RNA polymerase factor sigma-54 [Burkholderiales bacterium]
MKHTLQLKLSQHLTLTPQLQQSIRLLQLSTLELNQELERFLQENPLLERDDEIGEESAPMASGGIGADSHDGSTTSDRTEETVPKTESNADVIDGLWLDEAGSYAARDEAEESEYPQLAAVAPTLREHLNWQLNFTKLPDREKKLVSLLIDALDEDGLLTQPLEELASMLPEELSVSPEELQTALQQLQKLEPTGVGARDLGECLALQLQALPDDTPLRAEALTIATQHLDLLAARDFGKLKKILHCDDLALREAQHLITSLNPRPGADFAALETRYIVPDVIVKKIKSVWVASLNAEAMPKLRVNRMYADILHRNRDASFQKLASQLQEAKWLIKNVQQRFDTILRVSQAIVDRQRHFLEHGDVAMRPLVLREIAEALDLHESTVSRVTTQKYMLTPRGTYELKYFFGSHVTTETGGACSATAIRALIKQLVSAENPKKPLSDSQISEILGQQGIVVARRTIAKYREALQIPPVSMRKAL